MTEFNYDVFYPSTMVMDSGSFSEGGCDHDDFSFAYNNINFSDRVLDIHIEIESKPGWTKPSTPSSVRVESIHISSPILGARSPFFCKLFSNGMQESAQSNVTLQIKRSEETAFKELLKFMYSNNLTVTTVPAVVDVLKVADKFDVPSCIRHCSCLLRKLRMTPECVLVYLDLPSSVLTAKAFQKLTVAAKQFYAVHYKDITKFEDEILGLPLPSVEAIIASDDLHVNSEDAVLSFVLKWARANYPNAKDRREIIMTRLAKFIRYPYMTRTKLTQILTCQVFDPEFARKVVKEAMSFKAEVPTVNVSDKKSDINSWFVERAYKSRPIKMVEFEQPHPRCVVYMDLKRDVCRWLFPRGKVFSETFYFGGQGFSLMAKCNIDHLGYCFGLHLCMLENGSASFEFQYEFAARSKSSDDFVSMHKEKYTFAGGRTIGVPNMFSLPLLLFVRKESVHFIDDVLYLRVELSKLSKKC